MKLGAIILKRFKFILRDKENNRYIVLEPKYNFQSLIFQTVGINEIYFN